MYIRILSLYITIYRRAGTVAETLPRWGHGIERGDPDYWGGKAPTMTNLYLGPVCINADWLPGIDDIDPMDQPFLDVS